MRFSGLSSRQIGKIRIFLRRMYGVTGIGEMVCPESANFFYGEYGEYGVSRESISNPGKPGFSFCFSIQVPLLSCAISVFSVFSVSVREEKFLHT